MYSTERSATVNQKPHRRQFCSTDRKFPTDEVLLLILPMTFQQQQACYWMKYAFQEPGDIWLRIRCGQNAMLDQQPQSANDWAIGEQDRKSRHLALVATLALPCPLIVVYLLWTRVHICEATVGISRLAAWITEHHEKQISNEYSSFQTW